MEYSLKVICLFLLALVMCVGFKCYKDVAHEHKKFVILRNCMDRGFSPNDCRYNLMSAFE